MICKSQRVAGDVDKTMKTYSLFIRSKSIQMPQIILNSDFKIIFKSELLGADRSMVARAAGPVLGPDIFWPKFFEISLLKSKSGSKLVVKVEFAFSQIYFAL